jgi:AraC family ethanolamine operon transcriptional activator
MRYFRDAEQLSLELKHTNVAAMQVSRGSFEATWRHAQLRQFSLQFIDFRAGAAVCSGDAPADSVSLVVPMKTSAGCRLLGRELNRHVIGFYRPGSEHADAMHPDCEIAVLVFPSDTLDLAGENLELPYRGSHIRRACGTSLDRLRSILSRMVEALDAPAQPLQATEAQRSLADLLDRAITDVLRPHGSATEITLGRPKLPRDAIMRRIKEILNELGDVPIHAGELAAELDISQPSLQRVFQEWHGIPPARYLFIRRLHMVRRCLRNNNGRTVTEIAGAYGFWDLSRFSRSYKTVFGELPSETLRGTNRH